MNSFFNKLILGLGMIAIGVLYLLGQLNLLTFDLGFILSTYWPVFIIFFGLKGLVISRSSGGGFFIWSIFMIFLGAYFLLNNLGVDSFNYDNMYKFIVPVLLILFGLNILFKGSSSNRIREELKNERRRERETRRQDHREMKEQIRNRNRILKDQSLADYQATSIPPTEDISELPPISPPEWEDDKFRAETQKFTEEAYRKADHNWKGSNYSHYKQHDKVNRSSFIGDIYFGQESWELSPLNISLFIGDTIIDLTKASIPDGETSIHVSSFIGNLKIFIPNDMQIEVSVTASAFISDMKVLDRYESGLFKNLHAQTRDYVDGDKKIRIIVSTFIGDVIVKRVG
ncbi:MAG: cell wall-active antibiotics response protein LiaF [Paenibacillaceae bacterium]